MKNNFLLVVALAASASIGCQKGPQVRAEYGSDPKVGCATFVRERFEKLGLEPGDPFREEIVALDAELRRQNYLACLLHHELTGDYPGMK